MDKKIQHNPSVLQHIGQTAKKDKAHKGPKPDAHEHASKSGSSSSARSSGRTHHHRGVGAKGKANENAGEEVLDHHDEHERAELAKETYRVSKTIQGEKDRDDQDDSKNKDSKAQQQMLMRRLQLRQQGNLLTRKAKAKTDPPEVQRAKRDGFERVSAKEKALAKKTEHSKLETPQGPRMQPEEMSPHYLLKEVKESGEFFQRLDEDGHSGGSGGQGEEQEEEQIDPEWTAAVNEAGRKLNGVRGIAAVTRGLSDDDQPVVLVLTTPGLTTSTFESLIPSEIRGFPLLTAIPFDALPLRRERGFGFSAPAPVP